MWIADDEIEGMCSNLPGGKIIYSFFCSHPILHCRTKKSRLTSISTFELVFREMKRFHGNKPSWPWRKKCHNFSFRHQSSIIDRALNWMLFKYNLQLLFSSGEVVPVLHFELNIFAQQKKHDQAIFGIFHESYVISFYFGLAFRTKCK